MLKRINKIKTIFSDIDILHKLLLTLTLTVFFIPVLIKRDLAGDFIAYFLPHLHYIQMSIQKGIIPLWYPYSFNGLPEIFKSELAFFHPITIFIILCNLLINKNNNIAITGNIIEVSWLIYLIIGSHGFYQLARKKFKFDSITSLIVAIVYILNPFTLQALNTIVFFGIVILPYIILYLIEFIEKPTKKNFTILIFCNFILFAGGYPYFYVYLGLAQLLLAFFYSYKKFIYVLISLVISVLLSSFFLLPGIYIYSQSNRADISYEENAMASIMPAKILNIFHPMPYNDVYSNIEKNGVFTTNFLSWGTFVLIFLFIGFKVLKKSRLSLWLLSVFFIFMFYSFGPYFYSHKFLGYFIPVLSSFRSHFWGLLLTMFSGCVIIGFGIESLKSKIDIKDIKNLFWLLTTISFFALLIIALFLPDYTAEYFVQIQSLSRFIILLFSSLVLLNFYKSSLDKRILYLILLIIVFEYFYYFNKLDYHFLKTSYGRYFEHNSLIPDDKNDLYRVSFENNQFAYNTSHLGVYSFLGYETVPYKSWYQLNNKYGTLDSMSISNVKYHVTTDEKLKLNENYTFIKDTGPVEKPNETFISSTPGVPYWTPQSTNTHYIYKINEYLPRYFSPEKAISCDIITCDSSVKLPLIATFESKDSIQIVNPPKNDININVIEYSSNKIVIYVNTPDETFIVGSDTWDKGWHVNINDSNNTLFKVDNNFRGFIVPKGQSTVVLTYYPPYLNTGLLISGLTFMFFIIFLYKKNNILN